MHLDREHFACVEEFQQQWESAEAPGQLSHRLFWKLLQHLSDRPPFEGSIGNLAWMIVAVAEYPGFTDGSIARQRCAEQIRQTPAAPDPILIDRFESQGIKRYLTHEAALFATVPDTGYRQGP